MQSISQNTPLHQWLVWFLQVISLFAYNHLAAQRTRITQRYDSTSSVIDTLRWRIVIDKYGDVDKHRSRPMVVKLTHLPAPSEFQLRTDTIYTPHIATKKLKAMPFLVWPDYNYLNLKAADLASRFKLYELMFYSKNKPRLMYFRFQQLGAKKPWFWVRMEVSRRK